MNSLSPLDIEWSTLVSFLPAERGAKCKELGAMTRKRNISDPDTLFRLALAYAWQDFSLRSTASWSSHSELATLADVSVMQRLQKSDLWLSWMLCELIKKRCPPPIFEAFPYKVRLVDATVVCGPKSKGTQWRIHMSLSLNNLQIQSLELTDATGGESYTRFAAEKGEVLIGDRGYAHRRGIVSVVEKGAHLLCRYSQQNLPLQTREGEKFDLGAGLASLNQEGMYAQYEVQTAPDQKNELPAVLGRVIVQRKNAKAAEEARREAIKEAKKKGRTPDAFTLKCCEFILLFTTLQKEEAPPAFVLHLYRFRWQIENGFKRLKSIFNLDYLRAHETRLCRTYLYAKLIGAVLLESFSSCWTVFSPCGRGKAIASLTVEAMQGNMAFSGAVCSPRSLALEVVTSRPKTEEKLLGHAA